jgi:hypothetical protein
MATVSFISAETFEKKLERILFNNNKNVEMKFTETQKHLVEDTHFSCAAVCLSMDFMEVAF